MTVDDIEVVLRTGPVIFNIVDFKLDVWRYPVGLDGTQINVNT